MNMVEKTFVVSIKVATQDEDLLDGFPEWVRGRFEATAITITEIVPLEEWKL